MKKLLRPVLLALVLASFVSSLVFSVGSAAAPAQATTGNEAVIRFDMVGLTDTLIRGPYGSMTARFGLPVNWAFKDGSSLQLIVTSNQVTSASQSVASGQFIGATLNVTVDKNDIATIPLLAGNNVTYDVPIPTKALSSPLSDGRHELVLFLDAGNDCTDNSRHTSIVISSGSHFTIPYAEQSPVLDLTELPRPIFQRDSIFPAASTLVVPDAPTAQEMQAALTIAASFGRMSSGQMTANLVPMSQLTPEMRTGSQLIFVGKSSALSLLQGVALPAPLQGNKFSTAGMQPDDGILQMSVSPWNTGRGLLVVSGNSDAGVIKAAQALSHENIQTIGKPDLAVVADVTMPSVQPQSNDVPVPQDSRSFADMGYPILTMSGAGRADSFVRFNIPPGYTATDDTYLDMTFNHSGLLDFTRSGLTVFMNGNLIGSVLLSQQTASTNTQRIKIPLSSLQTSTNELKFEVDLAPLSQCSFTDFGNLWLSILPESILHMPLKPATAGATSLRDLGSYPYPFASDPTLSNLGFVLPKNDPSAWNTAAQIASQLGKLASGALFNIGVGYDGEVPDDIRNNRDLIVVGLPSTTKMLGELNQSLPAPFEKGTNVAVIQGQQVSYRFPTDSDLGYLELLNSPWNADRTILTVVGTTPAGIAQAGNALTNGLLRSRLKGNFVLVNGQSLSVADTRTGLGLASVGDAANVAPQQSTVNTAQPAKSPVETVFADENGWIPLVVGGLGVMIVIVLVIAALTRRRVTVTRR
jgi:hypothetical protein